MRAVIDGKRYDTETATMVANWANGDDPGNAHYIEEQLYRTPRGNWFITGWGGPFTEYVARDGINSRTWGSRLRPVSARQAMRWLELHGKVGAIEQYFADSVEDA